MAAVVRETSMLPRRIDTLEMEQKSLQQTPHSRNSRSRLRRVVLMVPPLSSKLGEVCFLRQQSFCVHSSILCPIQCSILELLFQRRVHWHPFGPTSSWIIAHILTAQTSVVENMVFRPPKKF